MKNFFFLLALFSTLLSTAQNHSHAGDEPFQYPNIEGYMTLKTDLHMHSVFSDGSVWPDIRVQEALMDGLDAIAITEHLEYQPHSSDIPHPDRNRAIRLAEQEARDHDLIIIPGSEITRSAPIGHNNAIFIGDANELLQEDALQSFKTAKRQGAFVFWNHPSWYAQSPNGNPVLREFQKKRIAQNELHGIEVINFGAYAEESLALALEHDLAILATSDVHGLIEWDYANKGLKRPLTLIFAEERSLKGMKEALFARRTVAVYNELLIGKEAFLIPLIQAMVEVQNISYINNTSILRLELSNNSSSDLILENQMNYTFYESSPVIHLKAGQTKIIQVKTLEMLKNIRLKFKVLSAYTAPKVHPTVLWDIAVNTP